MKCAVNLYSLESFHLPKLGVSCCLSGSRPCRPQNAFILGCNHTYLTLQVLLITLVHLTQAASQSFVYFAARMR